MESENQATEQPPFKNISARRVTFVGANNTPGGNEVVRLNNTQPAGPTLALSVSPGDQVNLETWAYYEAGSNYNNSISSTTMIAAIASAFGGVLGAPGEAGQIYNSINDAFTSGGAALGGTSSTTLPGAYLAYLVMDVNKNFTGQGGFFRVTTAGNLAKEKISSPTLTMEHPGYIYVFLYNRSNSANWVYFDDLKITHQRSPIVAGADFYPFGLPMEGREISQEDYRWGYQGQYAERDTVTGWNQFQLRMYDARFGRWLSVDPYSQFWSPYVGMGNMPNMGTDPDGGFCPGCGALTAFAMSLYSIPLDEIIINGSRPLFGSINPAIIPSTPINIYGGDFSSEAYKRSEPPMPGRNYNSRWDLPLEMKKPDTSPLTILPSRTKEVLTAWEPGFFYKWGQSSNILASAGYSVVDGLYVTSHFFMPWKTKEHMDGSAVQGWDASEAFANTVATMIPVARSSSIKRNFLKGLADSKMTPRWMNQWLKQGKVPPGYNVHHHKPVSIGGKDITENLKLVTIKIHRLIHKFDRRWLKKKKL